MTADADPSLLVDLVQPLPRSSRRKILSVPSRYLVTARQIGKFMAVGVLNSLIDAAAYFTLTQWLGITGLPILAKAIAYAAGMVNSYFWNRNWTFEAKGDPTAAVLPFSLTNLAALGINVGVMTLCLQWLTLPELIALSVATAASLTWNFFLTKLVVFG